VTEKDRYPDWKKTQDASSGVSEERQVQAVRETEADCKITGEII
jgi:hypothetical protein